MVVGEAIFLELQQLLKQMDIKLKYDRGYFRGGFYRYKDKKTIYLNRADSVDHYVSIIVSELKDMDLSTVSLSPSLKEVLQGSLER